MQQRRRERRGCAHSCDAGSRVRRHSDGSDVIQAGAYALHGALVGGPAVLVGNEPDGQAQDGAAFGREAIRHTGERKPEVAEHEDDTMGSVAVSQRPRAGPKAPVSIRTPMTTPE